MIERNVTPVVDEGVADRAYTERKIADGTYKVVEGEGLRFMAVTFPNGRFGILDMERAGSNLMAAGLDEADSVGAVVIANANGKYNATLIHKEIRDNRAKYGFQY